MNRLQKLIDISYIQYNISPLIKYIPNYIIKLYIKCNPNKYYEFGLFINFI